MQGRAEGTDPVRRQYETGGNLSARMSLHERYGSNAVRWQHWVFEQLGLQGGEQILEAGCGPGMLWRENVERTPDCTVLLTDSSPGMVREARAGLLDEGGARAAGRFRFALADVQSLPVADAAFDLAIANHMLYHVEDLDRAILELRRVIRPGGRLVASTNGHFHMRELDALAIRHLGPAGDRSMVTEFNFESGRHALSRRFSSVAEFRPPEEPLLVTEVQPLLDYLRSIGHYPSATDDSWQAIEAEAAAEIEEKGHVRVTRDTGLFICGG